MQHPGKLALIRDVTAAVTQCSVYAVNPLTYAGLLVETIQFQAAEGMMGMRASDPR
jgi:hypothetical protein